MGKSLPWAIDYQHNTIQHIKEPTQMTDIKSTRPETQQHRAGRAFERTMEALGKAELAQRECFYIHRESVCYGSPDTDDEHWRADVIVRNVRDPAEAQELVERLNAVVAPFKVGEVAAAMSEMSGGFAELGAVMSAMQEGKADRRDRS